MSALIKINNLFPLTKYCRRILDHRVGKISFKGNKEMLGLTPISLLVLIILLAILSFGNAKDFYYWKDDWVFLWSNKLNPAAFYYETGGGPFWFLKTGLLVEPYIRLYGLIDRELFQILGLFIKIANAVIFYFFVYYLTKKKPLAVIGSLVHASYSGAIEMYTWHRETALAVSFVLLGLTFFSRFIDEKKLKYLLAEIFLFLVSFLIYPGRIVGLLPFLLVWNLLILYKHRQPHIKWHLAGVIFISIAFFVCSVGKASVIGASLETLLGQALIYKENFFGCVGNLIRNPFYKFEELGGLVGMNSIQSVYIGYTFIFLLLLSYVLYLVKRKDSYLYFFVAITMIYAFYLPNWIYGGGGVVTLIGSTHRYFAVSASGVVLFITLFFQYFRKYNRTFLLVIVLFLNISFSRYVINQESTIRNKNLVEPIYKELNYQMKDDNNVELIVIDTPNYLKSFIVGGWYPYTYSYYRGVSELKNFPVVITFWEEAIAWVCANPEEKIKIRSVSGFANNRNLVKVNKDHAYAWSLSVEGKLTDRTDQLRQIITECQKKIIF
jgi:hypothetical protein